MANYLPEDDRQTLVQPIAGTTLISWNFELTEQGALAIFLVKDSIKTLLVDGIDYNLLTGIGDETGGQATLTVASAANDEFWLLGDLDVVRTNSFQLNGKIPSDHFNADFDRLYRIAQETRRDIDNTPQFLPGGDGLDMQGQKIINLADGVVRTDAATYGQLRDFIGISYSEDAAASALAAINAKTVAETARDLALSAVPTLKVANVATVLALGLLVSQTAITLLGYHDVGDGGGGILNLDAADLITPDDGFLVFVDAIGRRWKRDWKITSFVTPLMAGARANDEINNAGEALEKVVNWTGQNQVTLFIPTIGETAGGGVCRFYCDRSLKVYTNHRITGAGRGNVEIRFTNDSNGFVEAATGTDITAGFEISDLRIRGVADTSTSSTPTHGLFLRRCRDFVINIDIDKFVRCCRLDPQSTGFINGKLSGNWFQTYWPNPHNTGPHIGLWCDVSGSKKVQILDLSGLKIYSQLIAREFEGVLPAGKIVAFTLPLPLYKATGIKVYKVDANNFKTRDTDFVLFDETGAQTALASNWVNPSDPTSTPVVDPVDLSVTFGASWSAGEAYEIVYNDPWGNTAVFIEGGSSIVARGGHFGGYEEIIDTFGPDVIFTPDYVQLAYTFARVRAGAKDCEIWPLEFNNSIDNLYVVDAGAEPMTNPHAGRDNGKEIPSLIFSGASLHVVAGSLVVMQTKYPCRRKIEVGLNLEVESPTNSSILVTLKLMKQKNKGTAVEVHRQDILGDEIEDNIHFFYRDEEISEFINGTSDKFEYYLTVQVNRTDGILKVQSGGTFNSFIEITQRNPY